MKLLPENPTRFDYLHAIRALAARSDLKEIFKLADAGMFVTETPVEIDNGSLRSRILCQRAPRELAEKIVKSLLSTHMGGGKYEEGTRLEIRQSKDARPFPGRENERVLGGWCRGAAVDQVEDILMENAGAVARGANESPSPAEEKP